MADSLMRAYCRSFQSVFNIGARFLYWRRPIVTSGAGSLNKLPEVLDKSGIKKPLLVTGPKLLGLFGSRVEKLIKEAGLSCAVFSEVEANPSIDTVNAIYSTYKSNGCDGIIALGGGSPIDAAKAAAARVARGGKDISKMAGLLKVLAKIPPFIAIPTTSGTGTETTIAAVITDRPNNHKFAVMDLRLIPLYAILDAELMAEMPPEITATTGMDALTHAVEAYVCRTYNTGESLKDAEDATCLIFKYLERAYNNSKDMEAREQMTIASYKAGFAFTRAGVGNVHAIAHTLGGFYDTPHGLANAVILPILLEDYGKAVYGKLARLAQLTGVAVSGDEESRAKAFIKEIYSMNKRMNIPTGFAFIQDKDIPTMVKYALAEANPVYPVPVIYNEEHCTEMIRLIRSRA